MAAGDKNSVPGGYPTEPVAAYEDAAGDRVAAVVPTSPTGVPIPGDATNGMDVDVTRVQGTVTVDSELPAAAALSDTIANPTAPMVGGALMAWDGSQWVRLGKAATGNSLKVALHSGSGFGTETGIAANPLQTQTLPPANVRYRVAPAEATFATSTGVKELLTLWHPNTSTKNKVIIGIWVHYRIVQTAGTLEYNLQYISAENGTPGGTTVSAQQLNRGDANTDMVVRSVVTGAPTATGNIFLRKSFPLPAAATPLEDYGCTIYDGRGGEGIVLRAGSAEGLRITYDVKATLTTAPVATMSVLWVET